MKVQISRWRHSLPVGVVLAVAATIFPGALFGQATKQYPRSDFQTWMNFSATHQLNEKTDLLIGAGLRYGNDQGHLTTAELPQVLLSTGASSLRLNLTISIPSVILCPDR